MTALANSISPRGQTGRWLFWFWLILLLASSIVRWLQPDVRPRSYQRSVSLPAMNGAGVVKGKPVVMSWTDSSIGAVKSDLNAETDLDAASSHLPAVILLHGSPAASSSLMRLHQEMADNGDWRVITPDLPGFEGSSKNIPDYSVAAHSRYLDAFLDSLDVSQVHLVGYSMSGGVVIEAMDHWPERISSITLLSGIGVQEMELLGDYHLNHGIHGLQLAVLWGLTNLVPHFGWMDSAMLGVPYARNFYDTDQRPLRGILGRWSKPMLILHAENDPLVPFSAAKEHHRIVPQSEWVIYPDGGHGVAMMAAARVSADISTFLRRVDSGNGVTRAAAEPDRLADAARPFDASQLPPAVGFSLFILMFLLAISTLVNEDLASIAAGLMAARGTIGIEHAMMAAFAGILIGDIALYAAGRFLGRRILHLPPFSWFIDAAQLDRGQNWFKSKGGRVVIASRFIPGTRFPTYVAAGVLKAPFWTFLGYFLIATVFWTPFIVGLSAFAGEQILEVWMVYEDVALWVLGGLILLLYGIIQLGIPLFRHNGRRLFVSRWRRLTRWEFWPPWAFYPPLLLHIARLAIKHRSLMVFTAANPGIDTGGFLGESKAAALDLLEETPEVVARWSLIAHDPKETESDLYDRVSRAMKAHGLAFPVVLKPDVGDRGHRVMIVRSSDELRSAAVSFPSDFLIQEFVAGEEFGLFYIRRPSQSEGTIFSITEKRLVSVTGNGVDTLERLILDDDRAVCMASLFLKRHTGSLDLTLDDGIEFELVSVGTHSRGALFLDGSSLMTPELVEAVDAFASRMPGFFFGRFDVRVPSIEDLRRGIHIKVLEANGVSSEATHIYDPAISLAQAYRVLRSQWDLAFSIGAENALRGAQVSLLSVILKRIVSLKMKPIDRPDKAAHTTIIN